jgi:hypothetical protein
MSSTGQKNCAEKSLTAGVGSIWSTSIPLDRSKSFLGLAESLFSAALRGGTSSLPVNVRLELSDLANDIVS